MDIYHDDLVDVSDAGMNEMQIKEEQRNDERGMENVNGEVRNYTLFTRKIDNSFPFYLILCIALLNSF